NVVLAKSSSQPQLTYEAAASLAEFKLKKILLDKLEKSKSYRAAEQHKDLYDALVKSYYLNKDLFDSYGKAYSLKRGRDDKDKDEDPLARPDQGLKKRKTSKDAEPPKGSNSKETKLSSTKGTKSQPKTSSKFVQAKEPVFNTANTEMQQDQGGDLVQKKLSNMERDDLFELVCSIVDGLPDVCQLLRQVKEPSTGSQMLPEEANITRAETFWSDISKMTLYTPSIIHRIHISSKLQKNRLMLGC
ncbi:hypothetical protein Tco_0604265, partial [Tanacetum coccineum]